MASRSVWVPISWGGGGSPVSASTATAGEVAGSAEPGRPTTSSAASLGDSHPKRSSLGRQCFATGWVWVAATHPRLVGVACCHRGLWCGNHADHKRDSLLPEVDTRCHSHESPSGTFFSHKCGNQPVAVAVVIALVAAAVVEAARGSLRLHTCCCC